MQLLDCALDCGLDYGLDSYSFHAVPSCPVETLCTTDDKGPTPVDILYSAKNHWLEIRNQALKPSELLHFIYTCVFPIQLIYLCDFYRG